MSLILLAEATVETGFPILAADAVWAGVMVIVIGFVFLAAAVAGPMIRRLESMHVDAAPPKALSTHSMHH